MDDFVSNEIPLLGGVMKDKQLYEKITNTKRENSIDYN